MNTITKHKTEILISLITGFILICAEPFLNYLGNLFVETYLMISERFSVNYYTEIGRNNFTKTSETNNKILIIFLAIGIVSSIYYMSSWKKKILRKIDKNISKTQRVKNKLENQSEAEVITKEELLEKYLNFEKTSIEIREKLLKRDYPYLISVISGSLLVILLFTNFAINKSINNQNINFKNDILKIKPFVEEITITKFESDWAQIKNYKDFNHIKSQIDSLKILKKIK